MVIIIKNAGGVGVMKPSQEYLQAHADQSEEEMLDELVRSCYQTGTQFEIVDEMSLPQDSLWRDAWEFQESDKTRTV